MKYILLLIVFSSCASHLKFVNANTCSPQAKQTHYGSMCEKIEIKKLHPVTEMQPIQEEVVVRNITPLVIINKCITPDVSRLAIPKRTAAHYAWIGAASLVGGVTMKLFISGMITLIGVGAVAFGIVMLAIALVKMVLSFF